MSDDLIDWFKEADGFHQGTKAPHKWVLQAHSEIIRLRAHLAEVEAERDNETIKRAGWELEVKTAQAALATARRDALEEAANEVDCGGCVKVGCVDPTNCWHKAAQDIRALIDQEEPTT